jgi:hypothetical protein
MAKPVSQSRTMWVKKGTVVGGQKVKKGYVAQYGKPEKRVTAKVRLETATRRGKAGDVAEYKKGRYKRTVGKGRVDRNKTTAGGGVTKAQAAAARRATGPTPTPPPSGGFKNYGSGVSTTSIRGIEKASGRRLNTRLAGAGRDGVNANTSAGSAKTSSARDSLMSMPSGIRWGSERPTPATPNRPKSFPGRKTRLQKDASGQLKWVKVV